MKEQLSVPRDCQGMLWRCRSARLTYPRLQHSHNELEANLVRRGRAVYLVSGRRYVLNPGTLLWLFPAQEHLLVEHSRDFEMWVAVWRRSLLRQVCRGPGTAALRRQRPGFEFCAQLAAAETRRLDALFAEIHEALQSQAAEPFNAGLAYALLLCWQAQHRRVDVLAGAGVHPGVVRAAQLLRDDTEGLSLPELARRSFLSPSRLSRLFKQQTGVSLAAYRNRQRLDRFRACYEGSRAPNLLEAALEAGFGSYAQFHRVFKALTGRSPSQYKRGQGYHP